MYEDVKGKKLLIIGSDSGNIHIINQAKKMGVYTVVVDWETDYSKCPAKLVADKAWDMNYRDIDEVANRCKAEQIDGVIAGYSEYRVLCASKIAAKIGTPFYASPEQMELTRNKRKFKALCEQYGVLVPFEYCQKGQITESEIEKIEYPVIIKPADYGGRIGISICSSKDEIGPAVDYAMKYSESKAIVVEEYVQGTELAAIYTVSDGNISLSLINDKLLSNEGVKYQALCDVAITPSRFYKQFTQTLDSRLKAFLKGIGLKDGVAFFQMIANEEKIVVFEMGLRINGGNDWKSIMASNGTNYCEMLIRHSLTGRMGDLSNDNPCFPEKLCTYVVYTHGGTIGRVQFENPLNNKAIIDFHPYIYPGKVVKDNGTTQQKAFSIKIKAKTIREIADTIQLIQNELVVNDENGNDMRFAKFDVERLLKYE